MTVAPGGTFGHPWQKELQGRVDVHAVDSKVLVGNPLGDPTRRPLYVYLPPGVEEGDEARYPCVYVIQGYTGQLDMWFNRTAFEPNMFERVDELFSDDAVPRAVVAFVDAWTSYGGSQFINSVSTGRYLDHLCDEITAFVDERYPTIPDRDHRGLTGKSSGGYGAMVVPMLRSDVFGAFASHAGDALFECCHIPGFAATARNLRDNYEGSYEAFFERMGESDRFEFDKHGPVETYGYAACYSPDEDNPGKALLPFEIDTGRLIDDVWRRWLSWDPVRMVPEHAEQLGSMKLIYLDAGRSDEFYLDLGAQAVSKELDKLGVAHTLELFDGKHGGLQYRYPRAIGLLAEALTDR